MIGIKDAFTLTRDGVARWTWRRTYKRGLQRGGFHNTCEFDASLAGELFQPCRFRGTTTTIRCTLRWGDQRAAVFLRVTLGGIVIMYCTCRGRRYNARVKQHRHGMGESDTAAKRANVSSKSIAVAWRPCGNETEAAVAAAVATAAAVVQRHWRRWRQRFPKTAGDHISCPQVRDGGMTAIGMLRVMVRR